jgi:hypothetical protein
VTREEYEAWLETEDGKYFMSLWEKGENYEIKV